MAQEDIGLTLTLGNFLPSHADIIHVLHRGWGQKLHLPFYSQATTRILRAVMTMSLIVPPIELFPVLWMSGLMHFYGY